ncbi:hypothetical protein C8Q70DRAFT_59426 [Cubamyces menziesii]|nr:hypothetical protein C8Q70DRAFT_59426 [Cubamyces menziesii]
MTCNIGAVSDKIQARRSCRPMAHLSLLRLGCSLEPGQNMEQEIGCAIAGAKKLMVEPQDVPSLGRLPSVKVAICPSLTLGYPSRARVPPAVTGTRLETGALARSSGLQRNTLEEQDPLRCEKDLHTRRPRQGLRGDTRDRTCIPFSRAAESYGRWFGRLLVEFAPLLHQGWPATCTHTRHHLPLVHLCAGPLVQRWGVRTIPSMASERSCATFAGKHCPLLALRQWSCDCARPRLCRFRRIPQGLDGLLSTPRLHGCDASLGFNETLRSCHICCGY